MLPELARRWHRLERQKEAMLSRLANDNPARLICRPAHGQWSMLEVIEHLYKTEAAFVDAVSRNLANDRRMTTQEAFRALMVRCVMRSPMNVKVPAGASQVMPDGAQSLNEVSANWLQARVQLKDLLERITPDEAQRAVFRHPVSGYMTASLGLLFLDTHMTHHRYQLQRLRRATSVL